ncbi:AfsR/SARP family transcriptional regulator [Streptomyces halobius]|uniref:Winged helix-turn-helix domain-containing protein n=1 Tax=Streptomyces halobius TaxID=2879846 RepID=A0ABY4MLR6_9ACTN|nr:AfsR/SARP family transcriptional regulator [Streptomyces halobius]UQA97361.1 winged helix-turn-helix domain-containing protein [Streptomyces halobius]
MDFRLLGPLEILDGACNVVPTAPKPRQVIALLLMRRNTLVQTSELIDELWENDPPASAMTTLQTYIYKLRKVLTARNSEEILFTRPGGYTLAIPDTCTDLHRFEVEADQGKSLLKNGDPAGAAEVLQRSLALWRGSALVDVVPGGLLSSYVTRLEEFRERTLDLRIEADLQLGRHQELISELKSLVLSRPLHENVHASLMIALHRSGRRHEALEVYQMLRRSMIDNLGLEPGQELRALHQALLSEAAVGLPYEQHQRPVLIEHHQTAATSPETEKTAVTAVSRPAAPSIPVPAQLPADLADFTGRKSIVTQAPAALARDEECAHPRTATAVAVISGMPGVGKTALAVHISHTVRSFFEDGQLYADLRGSIGAGPTPADVLHGFLRALGTAESEIPADLEERSKLFRSTTVGRRLLILLDDVSSLSDVRPLLPGDPQCAAVITSRRRLHGLGGAWNINLGAMDTGEGSELLSRIIGAARVTRERHAASQLVETVGGLPLAVRCIGGRLSGSPGLTLSGLALQLTCSEKLLDELRLGELDVRSRYDFSYEGLGRVERSVFRLLSILPPRQFTAESVVELLGSDSRTVERLLQRFVDSHLINIVRWENDASHYAFPELTRAYARERLLDTLSRDGLGQEREWTPVGESVGAGEKSAADRRARRVQRSRSGSDRTAHPAGVRPDRRQW